MSLELRILFGKSFRGIEINVPLISLGDFIQKAKISMTPANFRPAIEKRSGNLNLNQ